MKGGNTKTEKIETKTEDGKKITNFLQGLHSSQINKVKHKNRGKKIHWLTQISVIIEMVMDASID